MKKFSIEKKGYNITEVDDYLMSLELENSNALREKQARIDSLRQENFELSRKLEEYKQKEKSISSALTSATDKANEIIDVSKQKYNIELNNLNKFYDKWNNFFKELIIRYPKMKDFDTSEVLDNIKSDIKKLMNNDYLIEAYEVDYKKSQDVNESFNDLLKKFDMQKKQAKKQVKIKLNKNLDKEKITDSENEIEYLGEHNKVNNIKPITSLTLENDEKDEFESLVDKFLQTNNTISKGYEKSILNTNKKKSLKSAYEPNESGFDLNEALNPTDDLTNIMKGFKLD